MNMNIPEVHRTSGVLVFAFIRVHKPVWEDIY